MGILFLFPIMFISSTHSKIIFSNNETNGTNGNGTNGNIKEIISYLKIFNLFIFSIVYGMILSPLVYFINIINLKIFQILIVINFIMFVLVQRIFSSLKLGLMNLEEIKYYSVLVAGIGGLIISCFICLIMSLLDFKKNIIIIGFVINASNVFIFASLIYANILEAIETYGEIKLNSTKCVIFNILGLGKILLETISTLLKSLLANNNG